MKLGILTDLYNDYKKYEKSCIDLNINYVIIDFLSCNWLDNIKVNLDCDGFLVRPTHNFQEQNDVYMERLYFLNIILNKKIYPSYFELKIYENKRNMAAWLKIKGFPHTPTRVFINKKEAISYLNLCQYPVVMKSNIGSAATGVRIIKKKWRAKQIVNNIFGWIHPIFSFGQSFRFNMMGINLPVFGNSIKHNLIIQDFKEIKWEWRIIKIGDSYFGHQKLLKGKFASGSNKVGWEDPPKVLLDMVRDICDKGGFLSMAVDIFETLDGEFLVNELQSLFGSYLDSQMFINGKPGRYKYIQNNYVFEEGYFNLNGSYLLRVEHFVKLINKELLN